MPAIAGIAGVEKDNARLGESGLNGGKRAGSSVRRPAFNVFDADFGHADGWFTWDAAKAAEAHLLWQAREFASGLVVTFSVEEIGRDKTIRVREMAAPFAISPMEARRKGGGYVVVDPSDPSHMRELCSQAATDLRRWLVRYEAAIAHVGGSAASMRKQLTLLEAADNPDANAA